MGCLQRTDNQKLFPGIMPLTSSYQRVAFMKDIEDAHLPTICLQMYGWLKKSCNFYIAQPRDE